MRERRSAARILGGGRNGALSEPPINTHVIRSGGDRLPVAEHRRGAVPPSPQGLSGVNSIVRHRVLPWSDDAVGCSLDNLAATQPVRAVVAAPGSFINVVRKLSQRTRQSLAEHLHRSASVAAGYVQKRSERNAGIVTDPRGAVPDLRGAHQHE